MFATTCDAYLGEREVDAAAVALVAEVMGVGVDAQEADQAVQLGHAVLRAAHTLHVATSRKATGAVPGSTSRPELFLNQ